MDQFVTCSQDKQVHLWDTSTHQPLWSKTIEVAALQAPTSAWIFLDGDVLLTPSVVAVCLLQDPGRSAGFHPSGAVLAVGTMTGRSVPCGVEHCRPISCENSNIDFSNIDLQEPANLALCLLSG